MMNDEARTKAHELLAGHIQCAADWHAPLCSRVQRLIRVNASECDELRAEVAEARRGRDAWTERCMLAEKELADIGGYVDRRVDQEGNCLGCYRWRSTCDAFDGGQDYGGPPMYRVPCLAGRARAAQRRIDAKMAAAGTETPKGEAP